MVKTLYWKDHSLYILNQLLLPGTVRYIRCRRSKDVAHAIKSMAVRGAPAIGVAAAFGLALAAAEKKFSSLSQMRKYLLSASTVLAATRPTAVNLFWALARMKDVIAAEHVTVAALRSALEKAALKIYEEDIAVNHRIGENGAKLLKKHSVVLTHCNAGALATAGYGTALGVLRSAHRQGKIGRVFVDETRPYLQGARLTAWELQQEGIPYVLITDNMAAHFMKTGGITAVIVGADRIAANGDTANKIGTYALSILAAHHGIPFYVAAPVSTIDMKTPDGRAIVIEERAAKEVLFINKRSIAPKGAVARHPGFDVTPQGLISAIITEQGVFRPSEIKRAFSPRLNGR
jgi:methylthioribose-1-phosphate isomerase